MLRAERTLCVPPVFSPSSGILRPLGDLSQKRPFPLPVLRPVDPGRPDQGDLVQFLSIRSAGEDEQGGDPQQAERPFASSLQRSRSHDVPSSPRGLFTRRMTATARSERGIAIWTRLL